MKDEWREELDFEFEKFFLDSMRTSKENIFSKSEEIEIKKKIKRILLKKNYSDKEYKKLLGLNNILESVYRYHMDHPEMTLETGIKTWEKDILAYNKRQ